MRGPDGVGWGGVKGVGIGIRWGGGAPSIENKNQLSIVQVPVVEHKITLNCLSAPNNSTCSFHVVR